MNVDLQQASGAVVVAVSMLAAAFVGLWIAAAIWAFRDMRSRSRDVVSQALAALAVVALNIPGLLIYLILRPAETLSDKYQRALEEEALLQEIEEKQVCPGCSQAIRDDWRVCPHCHTRLKKPCANCAELLELPWAICPYCETPQTETFRSGHRLPKEPQAPAAEETA